MFLIAVIQLFLGEIPAQEIWLSRPREPVLDSVGGSRKASCPICSLPQWWGACWLDGGHTLEVGADFLSSLLLFTSQCSCLSSLAACVFPLYYCSLLVFAGSFVFIFWTCLKCISSLTSVDVWSPALCYCRFPTFHRIPLGGKVILQDPASSPSIITF